MKDKLTKEGVLALEEGLKALATWPLLYRKDICSQYDMLSSIQRSIMELAEILPTIDYSQTKYKDLPK
jgi:hypothetical protein